MVVSACTRVWEVVGGVDKGGVLVRKGKDMSAPREEARLSTGAFVKEIELDDRRLHYQLLAGSGPRIGWVSIEISNKALLVLSSKQLVDCARTQVNSPVENNVSHVGQLQVGDGVHQVNSSVENNVSHVGRLQIEDGVHQGCARVAASAGKQAVSVRILKLGSDDGPTSRWGLEDGLVEAGSVPPVETSLSRAPRAKMPLRPAGCPLASWRAGTDMFFGSRRDLLPTFVYPGSLDQHPPLARFDIREHVCLRVGGFRHGQVVRDLDDNTFTVVGVKCMDGVPRLFFQPAGLGRAGAGSFPGAASAKDLHAMLSPAPKTGCQPLREAVVDDFDAVEDSDEEVVSLCCHCRLPLGHFVYVEAHGKGEMHGECIARLMMREMQEEEEERQHAEAARKATARHKYHIGWRPDRIPQNAEHARALGYWRSPQSMCCLVLDEQEDSESTVSVSETREPGGAVNLEFLSLALRCRISEGTEPAFSLDPTSTADDPQHTMQRKRFEPSWLAGTSAGEVLFQADYLLKELSMGEYDQPVIGMRSCFDFSEQEGHDTEWRAREWFVIKDARVLVSEDNVLIPYVEMAVETREQLNGTHGIEDSPITRPDHPLVKYAEAFTSNFDLIAERKSVIFHLRELAKASVLAKFLVEADVRLKEAWFHLRGPPRPMDFWEIPQLWNDRCHSQVRVGEGQAVHAHVGVGSKKHSVYGGVEFGLDRFSISRPSLASGSMLARGASAQMSRVLGVTSVRQLGPPLAGQPLRAGIEAQAHLQGVDLNLSTFDLTSPMRAKTEGLAADWGHYSPAASSAAGTAFWRYVDDEPLAGVSLREEDKDLLRAVFNPFLSDRRSEGDSFIPPDSSRSRVHSLRRLVEEEAKVRRARRLHFCSKDFAVGDAGPLFPSHWTSSVEIARGRVMQRVLCGAPVLLERLDSQGDALPLSVRNYGAQTPTFDKTAEDGTRFRIYRCGGMEVRTTQEHDRAEEMGAVFTLRSLVAQLSNHGKCGLDEEAEEEKIVKVTEYVERAAQEAEAEERKRQRSLPCCAFYVVCETARGNSIVTEMLEDGTLALEANPEAWQERNARARLVRSVDCPSADVAVREVQACRDRSVMLGRPRASTADRKHYAQVIYNCARGAAHLVDSGFSTRTAKTWSEMQEALGLSKEQMAKYSSNFDAKMSLRPNRKGTAFGGVLRL